VIAGSVEEILHRLILDRARLLGRPLSFQMRRLLEALFPPDRLFERMPFPRLKPGERPSAPLDVALLPRMAAGERLVLQAVPLLWVEMRAFLDMREHRAQARSAPDQVGDSAADA
jgi:hypothetical protein